MTRQTQIRKPEVRYFAKPLSIRAADSGPVLEGYAIVWDAVSDPIGGLFRETVRKGALDRTLADGHDIQAYSQHDARQILGRTQNKTLQLEGDDTGLRVQVQLPDTSYARDLAVSVRRGDIAGMSFGFDCRDDKWSSADGEYFRDLLDIDLFEVSVVTTPAYPATSVDVRMINDRLKLRSPRGLDHFTRELRLREAGF